MQYNESVQNMISECLQEPDLLMTDFFIFYMIRVMDKRVGSRCDFEMRIV